MLRNPDCSRTLKLFPCCEQPGWLSSSLKHIKHQWRTYGGTPRGVPSHRGISLPHIEERALHRKSGALRPILCAEIRPSISAKNLIPEEVNYRHGDARHRRTLQFVKPS